MESPFPKADGAGEGTDIPVKPLWALKAGKGWRKEPVPQLSHSALLEPRTGEGRQCREPPVKPRSQPVSVSEGETLCRTRRARARQTSFFFFVWSEKGPISEAGRRQLRRLWLILWRKGLFPQDFHHGNLPSWKPFQDCLTHWVS